MPGMPGVIIRIAADTRDAIQGLGRVDKALGRTGKTASKFGAAAKVGLGAVAAGAAVAGAALADFAVDAVKAAVAEDKAIANLENTLKNLGFERSTAAVSDWIDATARATTQSDDELRPALGTLLTVTKDLTQAQDLLGLAIDLAAQKQIPLEQATNAVAKAANGSFTALQKLVPGVRTLKQLASVVEGSDAAAFATLDGQLQQASESFGELQEAAGHGFIDTLNGASDSVGGLTDAINEMEPAAKSFGEGAGNVVNGIADIIMWAEKGSSVMGDFVDSIPGGSWAAGFASRFANPVTGLLGQVGDQTDVVVDAMQRLGWLHPDPDMSAINDATRQMNDYVASLEDAAARGAAAIAEINNATTQNWASEWNALDQQLFKKGRARTRREARAAAAEAKAAEAKAERERKAKAAAAEAKAKAKAAREKAKREAEARAEASERLDELWHYIPFDPVRYSRARQIALRRADGRAAQRDARTGSRP